MTEYTRVTPSGKVKKDPDYRLFDQLKRNIAKTAKDHKDYERRAKIAADMAGV